ncbi:MAG: hypothetical protein ACLFPD_11175, partial [Desulfosudaceae bacterium]
MCLFFFIFCLLLLPAFFLTPLPVSARQASPDTVDTGQLIERAAAQNLHQHNYWRILLHYEPALWGVKSQVDDPDFFLAPEGKTDPEAELKATIAELFQPDQQAAQKSICRFYARYQWLKKML